MAAFPRNSAAEEEVTRLQQRVAELEAHAREQESLLRELRESREDYWRLFSEMISAFLLLEVVRDAQGRPCDGVFLRVSAAFEKSIGCQAEAMLGRRLLECLPELHRSWLPSCTELECGGEPVHFDFGCERAGRKQFYRVAMVAPRAERVAMTFTDLSERKRVEEELERRVVERTYRLAAANEKLRLEIAERQRAEEAVCREQRILRQLLDLMERERKLVSYEIHDGLAQHLTGALFRLEAVRDLHARTPEEAWRTQDAGVNLLRHAVGEARGLISGLRPPILDESGVVAAIEYLICEAPDSAGPEIEFEHHLPVIRLAAPLEIALFRIVQESLSNARHHSRSPRVRIDLHQEAETVQLQIRDWGVGFATGPVPTNRFGLEGIRERARLLGGQAEIHSAPDQGTRVVVRLPLMVPIPDSAE